MSRAARTRAPAKINLYLRVLGLRPDGFHDLETLFQSIDLFDDVTVRLGGERVELEIEGPDLGPAEENLAHRAAAAFLRAADVRDGVRITLEKRIPAGAGLGGGSSDAAAVLRLLDRLHPDAVDAAALLGLAAELGSDVPFFLCGSPLAAASGRGELLTPLPALPPCYVCVVAPHVHVATAEAYAALDAEREGADAPAPAAAASPPASWADVARLARNDFEPVVAARHPEVARVLAVLRSTGAPVVLLSGSGGASFALEPSEAVERMVEAGTTIGGSGMSHVGTTLTSVPDVVDL